MANLVLISVELLCDTEGRRSASSTNLRNSAPKQGGTRNTQNLYPPAQARGGALLRKWCAANCCKSHKCE